MVELGTWAPGHGLSLLDAVLFSRFRSYCTRPRSNHFNPATNPYACAGLPSYDYQHLDLQLTRVFFRQHSYLSTHHLLHQNPILNKHERGNTTRSPFPQLVCAPRSINSEIAFQHHLVTTCSGISLLDLPSHATQRSVVLVLSRVVSSGTCAYAAHCFPRRSLCCQIHIQSFDDQIVSSNTRECGWCS
jgi:hypothetical protein